MCTVRSIREPQIINGSGGLILSEIGKPSGTRNVTDKESLAMISFQSLENIRNNTLFPQPIRSSHRQKHYYRNPNIHCLRIYTRKLELSRIDLIRYIICRIICTVNSTDTMRDPRFRKVIVIFLISQEKKIDNINTSKSLSTYQIIFDGFLPRFVIGLVNFRSSQCVRYMQRTRIEPAVLIVHLRRRDSPRRTVLRSNLFVDEIRRFRYVECGTDADGRSVQMAGADFRSVAVAVNLFIFLPVLVIVVGLEGQFSTAYGALKATRVEEGKILERTDPVHLVHGLPAPQTRALVKIHMVHRTESQVTMEGDTRIDRARAHRHID